jgi:hypothetical protein
MVDNTLQINLRVGKINHHHLGKFIIEEFQNFIGGFQETQLIFQALALTEGLTYPGSVFFITIYNTQRAQNGTPCFFLGGWRLNHEQLRGGAL